MTSSSRERIIFENNILRNLYIFNLADFEVVGKGGRRTILKVRLIFFENIAYGINIYPNT